MSKTKRAAGSKAKSPVLTKTAFITSMPDDTPAREIVEKAKLRGIVMTPSVVHAIRSNVRRREGAPARAPGRQPAASRAAGVEDLLRAVAAEVGLGRAIEVLEEARASVRLALRA